MPNILLILLLGIRLVAGAQSSACAGKKLPRFGDYGLETAYKGTLHPPVLATRLDHKFRSAIRYDAAGGPNFAGHFAIAKWGCGTGCQEFVIVDLKTGVVYDPPFYQVGFHYPLLGYDPGWQYYEDLLTFRPDSKLLVVEGCLRDKQCGRKYLIMEDMSLHQVAYDPDLLRDGTIAAF